MDFIETLMHFHLTRQEAAAYLALLAGGPLNGYEIAKQCNISRSNAYSAAASLVEKGAAWAVDGSPTRYVAVEVLEFCDNHLRQMQGLRAALAKHPPEKASPDTQLYITIKGQKHVQNKLLAMLANATARVYLSLAAGPTLTLCLPFLQALIEKGQKVVILTTCPFTLPGATVYLAEKPPDQLRLIVDSRLVLTGTTLGAQASCLYSAQQNLIDVFKEALRNEILLIEWKGSEPYENPLRDP